MFEGWRIKVKYIRLKNGRIVSQFKTVRTSEIVKKADTIKELCDEFVVEDGDDFAIFHNLKLARQTKGIIYGAIWTDKGLKYVAKMNSNGELELL